MFKCDCGEKWYGLDIAHCASCHETFVSPKYFDYHREPIGKRVPSTGPVARCISPETIGMVKGGRGLGQHWVLRPGANSEG